MRLRFIPPRHTLPSCIQPLSTKKCLLAAYWHCVSRPASCYSLAIPSSSGSRPLCAHQQYCCPSEDPPRATLHSGNFAPRSRHVDSLIFGLLRGSVWFAGYSKRLLGEAKTRRSSSAALAKEESQAKLLSRAPNRCFAVSRSRRIHTHLRWPCFTDDYINCASA